MKCNNCGNDVDNGYINCPYCGAAMTEQKDQAQFVYPNNNAAQGTYAPQKPVVNSTPMIVWAIINMVCCCLIPGIVALVFAIKANSATTQTDADNNLKKAKTWNIVALVAGVVWIILWTALSFLGMLPAFMDYSTYY